jgi:hypothetical protein
VHWVRVDTLQISGPNSWDGRTGEAYGATSDTLALRYGLATCTDVEGCHAGTVAAVSAPFTVNATQYFTVRLQGPDHAPETLEMRYFTISETIAV